MKIFLDQVNRFVNHVSGNVRTTNGTAVHQPSVYNKMATAALNLDRESRTTIDTDTLISNMCLCVQPLLATTQTI